MSVTVEVDNNCIKCGIDLPLQFNSVPSCGQYVRLAGYLCHSCKETDRLYKSLVSRTSRRGHECKISFEEFMEVLYKKPCHYCGREIVNFGVDRKNPKIGYLKDNIVPCCKPCNTKKARYSYEEFIHSIQAQDSEQYS